MRRYLPWLLRLLGPALLLIFLATSDLEALAAALLGADPLPILLSMALLPPFMLIKTWRWKLILHEMGLRLPFLDGLGLYTVGIYYGSVTPGQAGDFLKAWYLQKDGQPLAPSLLSVLLDRLCDLLVMAGFATLGIFALGTLLPDSNLQAALVVLMGVGLTVLTVFLVARRPRDWLMLTLLPTVLPESLNAKLRHWSEQFATLTLTPRLVTLVAIASLLSAAFTFWRLWLLFEAVGVHLPLYIVVGSSALIAVLQILPISIGGIGVRDAVLIAVVAPFGYSVEQAIAVSTLFLLITIEHIVVGFIVSFWYPLDQIVQQETPPASAGKQA